MEPPPFDGEDPRARFRRIQPNGSLFKPSEMTPLEIAKAIEMPVPLYPPACSTTAPQGWITTENARKILMMRDETRMNERGLALGDSTILRLYQRARADINRYCHASPELQAEADKCGPAGVNFVFTGKLKTVKTDKGPLEVPDIRASQHNEKPDGVLRNKIHAIRKAFAPINEMHWHRYLLPFGCYFWTGVPENHRGWKDWKRGLCPLPGREDMLISPFSVTANDVLYLVNSGGYLDRFMAVINIIRWSMHQGVNLLVCYPTRGCGTDADFRRFVTLERYMHFIGSLRLHHCIIQEVYSDRTLGLPTLWSRWTDELRNNMGKIVAEFLRLAPHLFVLDYFTVRSLTGSLSLLSQVFPGTRALPGATK